ncbi:hypothetical protein FM112_11845 [Gulosibacter sp. 10]|nr:hypothetical protein FM112_11845 [Gulosibacter sp. 10]
MLELRVLECAGAVLEWPLDAAATDPPRISVLDAAEADWLWMLLGEAAHVALLEEAARLADAAPDARQLPVELDGTLAAELHRLAHARWAASWWPESPADGIPGLDAALLDAEALELAEALEPCLGEAVDEDRARFERHGPEPYRVYAHSPEPRIAALAAAALGRLEEDAPGAGAAGGGPAGSGASVREAGGFADADRYALAAGYGGGGARLPEGVLSGTAPICWQAVPPGCFDAGESALRWSIEAGAAPRLALAARLLPKADVRGLAVEIRVGDAADAAVTAELRADGTAEAALPLAPATVWLLRPEDVHVRIGPAVEEPPAVRARVRAHAEARLDTGRGLPLLAAELEAARRRY